MNNSLIAFALFLVISVVLSTSADAQTEIGFYRIAQDQKPISKPGIQVPFEAVETGLGGIVRVPVVVSSDGSVVEAGEPSGPGAVCAGVARADVLALRAAAKEAAKLARFAPSKPDEPRLSRAWVNFDFPLSRKSGEMVFSPDTSVSAVQADTPPATGGKKKKKEEKFTIIGDANFSASPAPTPDYVGPVITGASGTPVESNAKLSDLNADGELRVGIVNGRAVSLVKPKYPPAALAVKASGAVSVQVLIDTSGEVFKAEAVSGHPLLRTASVSAACEAKFAPTLLSGKPVKVAGVIVYNFLP
jgi:outer membrane biosynthesis protein TonB